MDNLNLSEYDDDYLAHYGVLGMKWGVRKDVSSKKSSNKDYSANQRKRDRQVYGTRGEKRINKAMNQGDSISIARGREKHKRDKVLGRNKYTRIAVKTAGGVAGIVAGQYGGRAVRKVVGAGQMALMSSLMNSKNQKLSSPKVKVALATAKALTSIYNASTFVDSNPQIKSLVTVGLASAGTMAAGDLAVKSRLRAHGYDPHKLS